ncbi:MAG TPA: nickel pincer cofactor biosynthesis protein LarB [Geothermobacteraceae bacterium]|nr:nickel pincer cofactor biosynthesis protein LarB [Geothermobacteraceae bacterium]
MNQQALKELLLQFSAGELSLEAALSTLRSLPYEDVGIAKLDHHRELRQGIPEVIYGAGKNFEQLEIIIAGMLRQKKNILATRIDSDKGTQLTKQFPLANYDSVARVLTLESKPVAPLGLGEVLIVSAGTSDLPVAREAAITARMLGNQVRELVDVGVAGLHRLLAAGDILQQAAVIIVVAGMEGALPSVVGGLVAVPVIAVPTSIGYGSAFGGVAALLGMLNSCASGVTVVNIDNGFGAAFAATRINRQTS